MSAEKILDALRSDPARTAILTDIDGTLAPIVDRPEQAAVPKRASELLSRLSETYELVGCVSGRQAAEARRLVGVDGIAYAGNHGLELLLPGDDAPRLDASLDGRQNGASEFVEGSTGRSSTRSSSAERTRGRSRRCTGAARRTSARPSRGRTNSRSRPGAPGSSPIGAARCSSCDRSAGAARTPP